MDFFKIKTRSTKRGVIEVYPSFVVCRSNDIMIRAHSFYAIWDEDNRIWSTDEYDVCRIVDAELYSYADRLKEDTNSDVIVRSMSDFSSKSWVDFKNYLSRVSDNAHLLDSRLTFSNSKIKKKDYVSKRLTYPLEDGSIEAYDELMTTLYSPEERAKIEWAIGSIVAGDSRDIQKFVVLYGEAGTGKSTVLNIIQQLFAGYYTTFEAKALTSSSNAFSTEVFKSNPLVAIQHDGDLSKIEDNSKLNSIVSHEEMTLNEKYKPSYSARINCFLFMATNKPVKITDAKSGIIRRLIDISPTGNRVPSARYNELMCKIPFELGAIAKHCRDIFLSMGKNYYDSYRPYKMMFKTDVFFNFVEENFYIFNQQDGISLKQAYEMYKRYCDESLIDFKLPRYKFREEFKNYFSNFDERIRIDGEQVRSYFSGFLAEKFTEQKDIMEEYLTLQLTSTESIFDKECSDCIAQYANEHDIPSRKWKDVTTTLSDLDTHKVHYVKVPLNHIVIDFDLKDENGEKSKELNLKAAGKWPTTYAEFSKGGAGVHLHYIFDGDVSTLSRVYSDGIEIKIFNGNSSLRRRLSKCNDKPIAHISSGLPLKEKKVVNTTSVKSEKALRELIKRNLHKDIHPATKPSIDFIHKILEDAYISGLSYDVSDMQTSVLAFAANSTNNARYCIDLVKTMKFKSKEEAVSEETYSNDTLVFFDVEVFPNLFLVNWKYEGAEDCVRMINPTAKEIEKLLSFKLVGFNCRRYDNHILYARFIGYTNEELYKVSQKIISGDRTGFFGEAYKLSYADVYDFSSKKQSLKKFEIELGIHHQELGLPWDEPVSEDKWSLVAEYCDNDVRATEAVFKARHEDFVARCILADLSGLTVNDTTQQHAAKIIFGNESKPQSQFVYTDLSTIFPGYTFENGKSSYRGEDPGEGGYVYAEPGMYGDVALLDVASMHPTSIEALNLFGPFTKNFSDIKSARIAIKNGDFDSAKSLLNGVLVPYLEDENFDAKALSYALKIVINSVYGLTSAKFDNKFRDNRNVDNIVAKRGALFMIDLKHAVQEKGYTVAHIKTDSIKIPDATPEIINFVIDFGKKYGYIFEHEATYNKMCLVNNAVYVARYGFGPHSGEWTATGAQFQTPYIFKKLFTHEPIKFEDLCETRTVTSALYLDMNEGMPDDFHDYKFVGKAGLFCPIIPGKGGGILLREKDGKYYSVTGTKGFRWLESEVVKVLGKENDIDLTYYNQLVDEAIDDISKFGDVEWFISDSPYISKIQVPWLMPCQQESIENCSECKECINGTCRLGYDISDIDLKG